MKVATDNRGATILIAIGLSILLISFAIGIAKITIAQNQEIKAFKNLSQAKSFAESTLEGLLFEGKNHEAGYTVDCAQDGILADWIAEKEGDPRYADLEISCDIQGKNETLMLDDEGGEWYSVPSANKGDAGAECNKLLSFDTVGDIEKYYGFENDGGGSAEMQTIFSDTAINHPCHWGKLKFGNNFSARAVVPLYYDSGDINLGTKGIINPADMENIDSNINGEFNAKIRLRTPCKPPKDRRNYDEKIEHTAPRFMYPDICLDSDRYELDPGNPVSGGHYLIENDETIVMWQISGECTYNAETDDEITEICAMVANDSVNLNRTVRHPENTEITELVINNASESGIYTFKISNAIFGKRNLGKDTYRGIDGRIYSFLMDRIDEATLANWSDRTINKPTLQLAIIANELKDIDGKRIPYLEYQILTNTPVADSVQTYSAEIYYNGQAYHIEHETEQKKNVMDFAIQN